MPTLQTPCPSTLGLGADAPERIAGVALGSCVNLSNLRAAPVRAAGYCISTIQRKETQRQMHCISQLLLRFIDRAIQIALESETLNLHWGSTMKVISIVGLCLALSACATDYASQLSESNYGRRALNSKDTLDPAQLMNGLYVPGPSGVFCSTRCSQQTQLWSSGFAP
jgi:hypothetical protein